MRRRRIRASSRRSRFDLLGATFRYAVIAAADTMEITLPLAMASRAHGLGVRGLPVRACPDGFCHGRDSLHQPGRQACPSQCMHFHRTNKTGPVSVTPRMARVLLVEDHDLVRRFLCDAIQQAGHEAECVGTKAEAEGALAPGSHDVVISNIRLPDGSGYDVAAKAGWLGIKTVLITGHPDEALALEVAQVTHLRKPLSADGTHGADREPARRLIAPSARSLIVDADAVAIPFDLSRPPGECFRCPASRFRSGPSAFKRACIRGRSSARYPAEGRFRC